MRRYEYQESWTPLVQLHVLIILEARGRSRAKKFWNAYGQTHTAIAVAELNKKQKRFLLMKRANNKHTIAKIYGLCVFQVSPGNK